MPAADLDRRVTLQQPVTVRDAAYGGEQTSWQTVATVWARVTERMASEATAEGLQRVMTRQITVRIRHRADVASTWRLQYGNRVLHITGVVEQGRREWLDLHCEERS